ncbi:class I SAM-dependent methyltransferase [Candidatus Thioglobus sp.]|nr:class I SAM-dependent methyltransferase [Candidatus Thioglobus sp.]
MLKKIVKLLFEPKLLIPKVIDKITFNFSKIGYSESKYLKEQIELFNELGLDYLESANQLRDIYETYPDLKDPMSSCHHNLFAALSRKYKLEKILEIGTHNATGTALLSKLFPESKITTLDLPDNHPLFLSTYSRNSDNGLSFIRNRDKRLSNLSNIKFKQINSLSLTFFEENFDLIWVDGAHGNPVVTSDIINSIRMVKKGGFVLCDDVFKNVKKNDDMYRSIASYETIKSLSSANLINYYLVYKRVIKPYAAPKLRKYIAVLQK